MAGSIYDKALEGVDAANVTPGGVPGGDKYLRALEGVAAEPRQRAATNARVLSGTSTSQAASDRKLAAEVGAPEEVVASDRENFQAVATERRVNAALQDAPNTAAWMAIATNAKIAHDSVEQLSFVERQARAFQRGNVVQDQGRAGFNLLVAPGSEGFKSDLAALDARLRALADNDGGIAGWFGSASEQIGQLFSTTTSRNVLGGAALGVGAVATGAVAAPTLAVAGGVVVAGAGLGYLAETTTVAMGQSYADLREAGVSDTYARSLAVVAGGLIGAVEVAADRVGLGQFTSGIRAAFVQDMVKRLGVTQVAGKALTEYAKTVGVQTGTEAVQEIIQITAEEVGKSLEGLEGASADQIRDRIFEAGYKAFQAATVLSTPGAVMRYRKDRQDIANAEDGLATLQEISAKVQEAPITANDPQAAIEALTGSLPEVSIPADKLAEALDKLAPDVGDALLERIGVTREALAAEVAAGNEDIVVSPAAHAAVHVQPEAFAALADHIRLDREGLTAAEAKEYAGTDLSEQAKAAAEEEQAAEAGVQDIASLPPVREGFVRFYHGAGSGKYDGGSRFVSPDFAYARDYRGEGSKVFYVDVPANDPQLRKAYDDTGTNMPAPYISFELRDELAQGLKLVPEKKPAKVAPTEITDDAISILREAGFSDLEIRKMPKKVILDLTSGEALPKGLRADADGNLIVAAEQTIGIDQMIGLQEMFKSARDTGLTQPQYEAYLAKVARAREVARNRLEDLRLRQERERLSSEYKVLYEQEREVAQQTVDNEPVYALLTSIGAERIDRQKAIDVLQFAGEGMFTGYEASDPKTIRADVEATLLPMFPKTIDGRPLFTPKGKETGLDPHILAARFGFDDALSMFQALQSAEDRTQRIQTLADRRMAEAYPDLLSSKRDVDLALEAIHTDQQGKLMMDDLNRMLIARKQGKLKHAFVKKAAQDALETKRVSEIKPATFFGAFKRKAAEVGRAVRKGDRALAVKKAFEKVVAFEMARASYKVRNEVAQDQKFLRKFLASDKGRAMADNSEAADYFDAAKWLMREYGFTEDVGQIKEDRAAEIVEQNFPEIVARLQQPRGSKAGFPVETTDMRLDDWREAAVVIRQLVGFGRDAASFSEADGVRQLSQVKAELEAVARSAQDVARTDETRNDANAPALKKAGALAANVIVPSNSLVEFTMRLLDNGKAAGKWFNATVRNVMSAEFAANRIREKFVQPHIEKLRDVLPQRPGPLGLKFDDTRSTTPGGVGVPLSVEQRIMLSLNAASPDGMKRLTEGMKLGRSYKDGSWTEANIMAEVNQLTPKQAEWVQGMLDIFNVHMWPLVEAQYRRETGKSPNKVQGQQITLNNGAVIQGGYFPLLYDRSQISYNDEAFQPQDPLSSGVGGGSRAQYDAVFSGMTKARTSFVAPLALDLSRATLVLDAHIHYITHRQAIRDMSKLFRNPELAGLISDKAGPDRMEGLKAWMRDLAANGDAGRALQIQDGVNPIVEFARQGVLISAMTYSVATFLAQPLGITSSVNQLSRTDTGKRQVAKGSLYYGRGLMDLLATGRKGMKWANDVSLVLRDRLSSVDAAIGELQRELENKASPRAKLAVAGFRALAYFQLYTVDYPTWFGAYRKAQEEGRTPQDAAVYADSILRTSQGSGALSAQSSFQRARDPWSRAVNGVMTYPTVYFNAMGEAVADLKRQKGIKGKLWTMGSTLVLMTLIPSILDTLRGNAVPEDEEDADALFWLRRVFGTQLQAFGVFGQIAGGLVQGYKPSGTLVASYAAESQKLVGALAKIWEEEELTAETARKLVKPAFVLGRIPGGSQADRFLEALEKDSENPLDYILGPPPK